MITVQKVSKVLHSWLMISLLLFLSFSAWDCVFPGYGYPGFTPYTAVANMIMSAFTIVLYLGATQLVMKRFGLKDGE